MTCSGKIRSSARRVEVTRVVAESLKVPVCGGKLLCLPHVTLLQLSNEVVMNNSVSSLGRLSSGGYRYPNR